MQQMMSTFEIESEWLSKYDILTGRLSSQLSPEAYQWVQINQNRTNELIQMQIRSKVADNYQATIDFMKEWIDIPEDYMKIISLWIIGTYIHKQFDAFPYIFLNAMRGSGKTRLLSIISHLQKNGTGDVLNNPSEAALFRTAQDRGLILDEFESQKSKDKQTMSEYLNSCYKKGGVVMRMEKQKIDGKEKQIVTPFQLYTPIAMANINGLGDVLGDRSITLVIEKSINPALVKKIEDFSRNPKIKEIKTNFSKFNVELCNVYPPQKGIDGWNSYINDRYSTLLHTTTTILTIHSSTSSNTQDVSGISSVNNDISSFNLHELYLKIDNTGIFGRNLELFFPLIMIAYLIDEDILEDTLRIVVDLNKNKKSEEFAESRDVPLIEFISKLDKYRFEYVFVSDLFTEYKEFIGNMGNDEESRWLNITWFGLALKRLKLIKDTRRITKGKQVRLEIDHAKEKILIFKTPEELIE